MGTNQPADEAEPDYQFDMEWDDAGRGFLTYRCPACHRKDRIPIKGKQPGDKHTCPCGETTVELTGDSLDSIQRTMDDPQRQMRDVFKGL